MNGFDKTYEYALSAVPAKKRKSTRQLVFILIGFACSTTGLNTGAQIGKEMPFFMAAGACFLGNLLLFLNAFFWGNLACKSGYSSAYLVKKYLGNKMAIVFSSLVIFFMIVWIGMNGELLGRAVIAIFPDWSLPVSVTAFLVIALITASSLNGWRSMELLSRIFVPFILLLTMINLIRGISKAGIEFLFAYQPENGMAFGTAVGLIAGNFALSSVTVADICRFAKNQRSVFFGVLAYALTLTANNLCGILIVQSTGANNLNYGMYLLGMAGSSFLWMLLCTYTTQNVNMYTGSLAIQKLVHRTVMGGNISHKMAVLFIGGFSIIAGVLGVSRYLKEITGILILVVLPLTVMVFQKSRDKKTKEG